MTEAIRGSGEAGKKRVEAVELKRDRRMASQVEDAAVRAQGECGPSDAAVDGGEHVPFQEFCEPPIDDDEADDAGHGVRGGMGLPAEEAAAETPVVTALKYARLISRIWTCVRSSE